ncbi:MAG: pyridoxamine 5'-phosphate oxidase family protein [Acidimicrobiia bacterium]|nr:pyridoxamine 5'-phosphate oxidase family protein [Acidimicrobiia bacterium]
MSRRDLIRMSTDEIDAYLAANRHCRIGTIAPDGGIHLVAMTYVMFEGVPAFWSYGRAQKIRNLERNPAIGFIVDTGVHYSELKGVHLQGRGEIVTDPEAVARFAGVLVGEAAERGANKAQASAPKRVVVKVHANKVLSWDHAKLGGGY